MLADPDNAAQLRRLQEMVDNMQTVPPTDDHHVEKKEEGGDARIQKNEGGGNKQKLTKADKHIARLRLETLHALRQHAGGASPTKPRQLHGDLPYLYAQAHALNPHFQARMVQWAGRGSEEGTSVHHCNPRPDSDPDPNPDTTVHHCGVKQRRRAIDKTWRCYAGDPSLLLDLARGSITCRSIRGIMECLAPYTRTGA